MASRGIIVTDETIRQWTLKFGQGYTNELCRCLPKRGEKWHPDEVLLTLKGKHHYLWHAVDQHGHVLDILIQSRRYRQAVKHFFASLGAGLGDGAGQYIANGPINLAGSLAGALGRKSWPSAARSVTVCLLNPLRRKSLVFAPDCIHCRCKAVSHG